MVLEKKNVPKIIKAIQNNHFEPKNIGFNYTGRALEVWNLDSNSGIVFNTLIHTIVRSVNDYCVRTTETGKIRIH